MNSNDNAIDVLTAQIAKMVSKCVESASFDRTKQGVVTTDLGNGKYSVSIRGTVYTVPSATSDTYSVNDRVLVLFVQNNAKRKYIIGKA